MATDNRVRIKEVGGVEITDRGFSVWWSDDRDRHWTFRIGGASGIADVHQTHRDGSHDTLWVAWTSELIGWLEQALTLEAAAGWIDGIAVPVTWEWVRSQRVWLAPVPTFTDEERERLAGAMATVPLEEMMGRDQWLVPSPLPLDLFPGSVKPGAYLVYPDPTSDNASLAVMIWAPGASGRQLLWLDPAELPGRAEALLAPYRADLQAMDRAEVRDAHRSFLARLRARRRPQAARPA